MALVLTSILGWKKKTGGVFKYGGGGGGGGDIGQDLDLVWEFA